MPQRRHLRGLHGEVVIPGPPHVEGCPEIERVAPDCDCLLRPAMRVQTRNQRIADGLQRYHAARRRAAAALKRRVARRIRELDEAKINAALAVKP